MKKKTTKKKEKVTERYLVISEETQSIEGWHDSYIDATNDAILYDNSNIVILKISAAWRVYLPEEPEYEVKLVDLATL